MDSLRHDLRQALRFLTGNPGLAALAVLAFGLALAALVAPAMSAFLFGVGPWDWRVYAAVAAALGLAGMAASLLPARGVVRLDLVQVLRGE
ncbi:MAG TPA: hypothetical protein VKA84_07525 [Gemmatimonadaceae bacterium]|nr:hypothetical protein [Gemmatimonadaceae bacterium]